MASGSRNLFTDEPPDGCATAYRNLMRPQHRAEVAARQLCEEMWRLFQPLADPQFLKRFPFDFHQRWFEMYLGASLMEAGLDPSSPTPGRGPDFTILIDGRRVYIEAVSATAGDPLHEDAVPEPVYNDAEGRSVAVGMPHDRISFRIAHSVRMKLNAFDRYRGTGLVAPDDACVIAVNLRDIPQAWADDKEGFFRAIYGVGNRYVVIDRQALEIVAGGHEHRTILARAGGALEAMAPMLDPNHADVSAILGSSVDAWNVRTPLGDDFVLMPHANASAPVPRGLIKRGVEISVQPGKDSGSWDLEETDYGTPAPRGPEPLTVEHEGRTIDGEWQISGQELRVSIAGRGCAVPFRNGSGDPACKARAIALELVRTERARFGVSRRTT